MPMVRLTHAIPFSFCFQSCNVMLRNVPCIFALTVSASQSHEGQGGLDMGGTMTQMR